MTNPAPDRTYDPQLLMALDPRDVNFARTFVRTLLRDLPEVQSGGVPLGAGQPTMPDADVWPEFSRTDLQLNAALELDAVLDTSPQPPVKFYRPHVTAARLYLGDPLLWRSRAVGGSSESRRDSGEIVSAWLAQGRALDAQIPETVTLPPFDVPDVTTDTTPRGPRLTSTVVETGGGGW